MHVYTDEQEAFVREISRGRYNQEITDLFNEKFGTSLTVGQIKSFKQNHKIRSGVPKRRVTEDDGLFTKVQKDFLKDNVKGLLNQEMADLINKKFNLSITAKQIYTYKKNHRLTSDVDARFKKGQKAWNKGMKGINFGGENGKKTQFKKGQTPINHRVVGSERINVEGYVEMKVAEPNIWKLKQRVLWEEVNGHVPEGHVIIFGDGNRQNFDIDNLILVSRGQLAILNNNSLIQGDADLTRTGIIIADTIRKISELERKKVAR